MYEQVCHCGEAANHQWAIAAAFWIIWIVSVEECSSLTQNFTQICCSTQLFWMRWPHSTHTQWCLPPPLTSTLKSSLFTHAHSSPLSLAARLHHCCTNCSLYIDNGWTFSGQTSEICIDHFWLCAPLTHLEQTLYFSACCALLLT